MFWLVSFSFSIWSSALSTLLIIRMISLLWLGEKGIERYAIALLSLVVRKPCLLVSSAWTLITIGSLIHISWSDLSSLWDPPTQRMWWRSFSLRWVIVSTSLLLWSHRQSIYFIWLLSDDSRTPFHQYLQASRSWEQSKQQVIPFPL